MKPSETDMQQDLVQEAMRNLIEAPIIGAAPAIEPLAVGAPVVGILIIGSSSSTTEIRAIVVRVCSQLEEHAGGNTLLLGDTPLLGQYQFSAPEKTVKRKRGRGNEKNDGKMKKVVKDLMVDDDVEVGREVKFKAISSEYGGDLLEWIKGDEKDDEDKKDVEEKVKSEEEQPQVVEEKDSELPTVVVHYNRENGVQYANELFDEEEDS
ncbi:hypothetical protein GIB67_018789 [Kingdonia uniflora]|uniref:Uncharacterized protein n=1 Tax=Kingdonia uniflora TaxID=39325 RepID=A0A7J7NDU0_9MAGN|nr:hypothetical protein GIB67_018789 [Kingdonia uniflora]